MDRHVRFLKSIKCSSKETVRQSVMHWMISLMLNNESSEHFWIFAQSELVEIEEARRDAQLSMALLQFLWSLLDEIGDRSAHLRRPLGKNERLQLWIRYHRIVWEMSCVYGFGSPAFCDEMQQRLDCDSDTVAFDFSIDRVMEGHPKYAQASASVVASNLRNLFQTGSLLLFDGVLMREFVNPVDDDVGVIFVPLIKAMVALRGLLGRCLQCRQRELEAALD